MRLADNTSKTQVQVITLDFHSYARLVCTVIAYILANFFNNTEQSIKPIREIREKRLLHDQADDLLQFLCHEIIRSDFSNAG